MPFEKDKTGVIYLGASAFPQSKKFQGSQAFKNAKNRIKGYFDATLEMAEKDERCLDLFDAEDEPNTIDTKINQFLKTKTGQLDDLVIYYVGHGGYDNKNGFLMAIRQSKDENLGVSSITAQNLGRTLSLAAAHLRLFLIFDCCFAGELYRQFQSPIVDIIQKNVADAFPENGIALLCSSSKDNPSMIVRDGEITMFSEGLDYALREGNPVIENEYLSLRELSTLTYSYIKKTNPGEAIRPEVHSPKMPNGDIADLRHFRNNGYKLDKLAAAFDYKIRQMSVVNAITANNLSSAGKLTLDFSNDFNKDPKVSIEAVLILAKANALEEDKPAKGTDAYKEYLANRENLYERMLLLILSIIEKLERQFKQ